MELQETIFVLSALLLSSVDAQEVTKRSLQPWLTGLTAVVGFLFIVFVLMLAKRFWCSKERNEEEEEEEEELGKVQSTQNPYENIHMRPRPESPGAKRGRINEALEPDVKATTSTDDNRYTSF